ncbi:MAG: hypothetical protein K2X04_01135 [Burkholderiales bacterium]|jgi:hypothetical protein|nr:hypothetical protein [Burkholderiales bacterium]
MALATQEKYDYVHNVLINKFQLTQRSNCSALFDLDGNLLVVSEETRKQFGIENILSVLNKSFNLNNVTDENIATLTGFSDAIHIEAIRIACKKMIKLQQIVIHHKIPVNFISLIPRDNIFSSRLVSYVPVFHDSGELVALQTYSSNCNLFGINEYLTILQEKNLEPVTIKEYDLPIKLTTRQHEVLFLLVRGLSQRQAADVLEISRGNLAKITVESICPKFNIFDADTSELIDRAIKLAYHRYIPQSLCRPCIIILDNDIIDSYFT